MELAIPILAMGGLYASSSNNSNKNNKTKEKFSNNSKLINDIPSNYPAVTNKELSRTSVNNYKNPNQRTDKYFENNSQDNNKNHTSYSSNSNYSLTGEPIDSSSFKHNNQVPFFGSKIRGAAPDFNNNETILDNATGSGSQTIKKTEQAPLFKPEDNVQWSSGAPNMNDFMQSRVNQSNRHANFKPWEEQRVAPGLNKGFTTSGEQGYNSSLNSRDSYKPKDVNELRVATNPKTTFSLDHHQGPANYYQKNSLTAKSIGKVEKHLPDTYYENTQDKWFTTTGVEKKPTARSHHQSKTLHQGNDVGFYEGVPVHDGARKGKAPTVYEDPHKCDPAQNTYQVKDRTIGVDPTEADYGVKALKVPKTNRDCNKDYGNNMGYKNTLGALFAPILDVLRPSKKEDVVENINVYGQMNGSTKQSYMKNPYNDLPITHKEMNIVDEFQFTNVQYQHKNSLNVANYQANDNQRDTTTTPYGGIAGGGVASNAQTNYESNYNQINNTTKEKVAVARTNMGNASIFNNHINMSTSCDPAMTINQRDFGPTQSLSKLTPSVDALGHMDKPMCDNTNVGYERLQPDLLDAFKANPYTHSLNSSI